MSFATAAELGVYLNRTLTSGQEDQADMMLAQATEAIRAEARQTISRVTSDVVVLRGNWGSTLVLPQRPVVSVASVDIDGTVLAADSGYSWDGQETLYRGDWEIINDTWSPRTVNASLFWGGAMAQVNVTYTHGFADGHDKLNLVKGICLAMVARTVPNPGGAVTGETLGPYSVTYGTTTQGGTVGLNASERRIIRKAFGR